MIPSRAERGATLLSLSSVPPPACGHSTPNEASRDFTRWAGGGRGSLTPRAHGGGLHRLGGADPGGKALGGPAALGEGGGLCAASAAQRFPAFQRGDCEPAIRWAVESALLTQLPGAGALHRCKQTRSGLRFSVRDGSEGLATTHRHSSTLLPRHRDSSPARTAADDPADEKSTA